MQCTEQVSLATDAKHRPESYDKKGTPKIEKAINGSINDGESGLLHCFRFPAGGVHGSLLCYAAAIHHISMRGFSCATPS
eukprot:3488625-Amphidinium_carterae.1